MRLETKLSNMRKIYLFIMMVMTVMTSFAQTSVDVVISPTSGDLSAAINEAVGAGNVAKNITINLAAGGSYTLSSSIYAGADVVINGAENAVIDVTNCKAPAGGGSDEEKGAGGSFILMSTTPQVTATNGYYRVNININNVTLKGLQSNLFYDNKIKYCVVNFTIDNVVMQLATASEIEGVIAFKKGGYKDFTIKNSTVYGNNYKKLKSFVISKGNLQEFGYDITKEMHNVTYLSNTFVNVLAETSGESWANDGFVGEPYVNYNIQKNIWYNCGIDLVIGLVGKDIAPTAKKLFAKNTYYATDENSGVIKDQAVEESVADTSNDILTTDPTFADIANGDFHLHAGSLQAKFQTGDPRWVVAYSAAQALPADIVLNLKVADDITDRLEAAKRSFDKVGDITILLAEGAKYMITQPIKSSGSVTITGLKSLINCTRLNGPLIILEGTEQHAYNMTDKDTKGDLNPSYKYVETVSLTGIQTTLKKNGTVIQDHQKTLVESVIIDDCVFEIAGANNLFDFDGFPLTLEITNTTFWSEAGHKGHLLRAGGRTRDLDKSQAQNVLVQAISIDHCTLYQISVGVGLNDLAAKASRTLQLTLTNSILYNCTVNGGEVKGWMGGAESDGPTMLYDYNTYWNNGALQAGWIDPDESLDGRDHTKTVFTADPGFEDVEAGSFSIANKAPQANFPEGQTQYGDPRWATWPAGNNYVATSFVTTQGSVATDKVYANEGSVVTATVTPMEGYVLETFTVTDASGTEIPVTTPVTARAAAQETTTVTRSFTMPASDVTIKVTFIEDTTGIKKVQTEGQRQDGKWYTLSGMPVEKPTQPGIYIQNGKKILKK